MTHTAVIGVQWGDEGKGKIVDDLTREHDVGVRYAGGGNAGHTVVNGNKKFVLHLIPCTSVYGKTNVIGNSVVANPALLAEEMNYLAERGRTLAPKNLVIAERAHIVTPYQLLQDLVEEIIKSERRGGEVGTTLQGIGPTYQAKMRRTGIRFVDLVEMKPGELESALQDTHEDVARMGASSRKVYDAMNATERRQKMTRALRGYVHEKSWAHKQAIIDEDKVLRAMLRHRRQFAPFVQDVPYYLESKSADGRRILFEGAQGTLLDIDGGTYPYVTSSNTTMAGVRTSFPWEIEHVLGVMKAYTTRVGNGAFPTERTDEAGVRLQQRGQEFGATTGRPRRCGWEDLVIAQYACCINGFNELAVTKLDVLDAEKEIPVCVAYEIDGKTVERFPASDRKLARAKPVYKVLPGWQSDTSGARRWRDLPRNARNYVTFIESRLNTPVKYVSIGARRDQVIVR